MSLGDHVRTLGRGPGRSRSLTFAEAANAMTEMLSGKAAPEAIGALLMLLRMKGETAEEIAGLASAAQQGFPDFPVVDLDWPSYAAGRTRGAPWFLLSARLVAEAGHRVLLHGWNGPDPKVRAGLATAGIATASSIDELASLLDRDRIAYIPLDVAHPRLLSLLRLREVLGLRSCINTVCRMLNPARAEAAVQGVFHPSYRLLQADAAQIIGLRNLSVIKGAGGEFECNPAKPVSVLGIRDGQPYDEVHPPVLDETRRLSESGAITLADVAAGQAAPDFETRVILGTATLAFQTLGVPEAETLARTLWSDTRRHVAA